VALEICIDSVAGAIAAQQNGADRVELCDNLVEGGTTPSAGTIRRAVDAVDIGVNVIIRPRGGDFCYTDVEFEVMKEDVAFAKSSGANAVVIGILRPDGTVDAERCKVLIDAARPLCVTFHRAFDMVRNPHEALGALIGMGVDRVLTSGLEDTALEGLDLLSELVKKAGDRIVIMPGGGITERNVGKILSGTGAREVHVSARSTLDGAMTFRDTRAYMGGEFRPPEYSRKETDGSRIKAFRAALG
jgi:copper homeostasis protein